MLDSKIPKGGKRSQGANILGSLCLLTIPNKGVINTTVKQ